MKKILFVAFMAALLPAYVQTKVGEIDNDLAFIIPSVFTLNGHAYIGTELQSPHQSGEDYDVTMRIYNNQFQIVDSLVHRYNDNVAGKPYVSIFIEKCAFWNLNELTISPYIIAFTQNLFNSDNMFEFFTENYRYLDKRELISLSIKQTNGNILDSITPDYYEGYYASDVAPGFIMWNGIFYLTVEWHYETLSYPSSYLRRTDFYQINRTTQSIQRVSELPFNVFPSLVDRSQEITIELGEGNNATEISVIDANGRVLETIPVQAGQREIKVPASKMGHGLNLLNARDRQRQATKKIIVK
jgi:hypothetical protein